MRFVVSELKEHPAIVGWMLWNEPHLGDTLPIKNVEVNLYEPTVIRLEPGGLIGETDHGSGTVRRDLPGDVSWGLGAGGADVRETGGGAEPGH